jgi:hypothetical protein
MDPKFIEGMRCMNQIGAWEKYGKDALAVVSEGPRGQYEDNPTVNEYKAKGYKLVDGNMFGHGNETGEILIFVKIL